MQIYQVDAFAQQPFEGNPAAVCLLDREADEDWMQAVAAEMNLSETAFLVPSGEGFHLRWFTPLVEVDLCGHATLASAHILFQNGIRSDAVWFATKSGVLRAVREGNDICLDFPSLPVEPASAPDGLGPALGALANWVGRSGPNLLVELAEPADVAGLSPDFRALAALEAQGVIATAPGGEGVDFVSRYFAPKVGIDEDPATGSVHCVLGPYWSARLGKLELTGRQLSARGAQIGVRVLGKRVQLVGHAITMFRGELSDSVVARAASVQ